MSAQRILYSTLVADPPWPIKWDGGPAWRKDGRGKIYLNSKFKKSLPYPTMTVQDISRLAVTTIAAENAVLWLWTTDTHAYEGEAALVARSWGFEPICFFVWQKGMGLGNCPRPCHELCLVCKRGKSLFTRKDLASVQKLKMPYENGARKHSAKPDGFFDIVMSCSPGPYLELFARSQRLGWDSYGNECLSHIVL